MLAQGFRLAEVDGFLLALKPILSLAALSLGKLALAQAQVLAGSGLPLNGNTVAFYEMTFNLKFYFVVV